METVGNPTIEQARDMIRSIDASLIPECRDFDTYTETDEIWRIGDYGYVDADVYEQAFRDYEARNGKAEWARNAFWHCNSNVTARALWIMQGSSVSSPVKARREGCLDCRNRPPAMMRNTDLSL